VYRRTAVIHISSAIFGFKLLMASVEILAKLANRPASSASARPGPRLEGAGGGVLMIANRAATT
jgi:hypothetical protein